jgi:hypothetical protein
MLTSSMFQLVGCLAYSSAVKMKLCSPKTLVNFNSTIWHHIQNGIFLSHCGENLKSNNVNKDNSFLR